MPPLVAVPIRRCRAPARALRDAGGDNVTAFEIVGRPALELVLKHIPNARDPLLGKPAWQVLIELSGPRRSVCHLEQALEAAAEDGIVDDAVLATSQAQTAALWRCAKTSPRRRRSRACRSSTTSPCPSRALRVHRARRCRPAGGVSARAHVCFGTSAMAIALQPVAADANSNNEFIAQPGRSIASCTIWCMSSAARFRRTRAGQLKREEVLRYKSVTEMDMIARGQTGPRPARLMNPGNCFKILGQGLYMQTAYL